MADIILDPRPSEKSSGVKNGLTFATPLFAFVIIHQSHEQKEINLCLAAFTIPPLEN